MKMFFGLILTTGTLLVLGCGQSDEIATDSNTEVVESLYTATTEPVGAVPVGEARKSSEDGQDITLVGVIGGSREPFVDGLAAFTVVDPKVPYCAPEEGCATPWDYCCTQDQVNDSIATIKVVDDSGKLVAQSAREFLDVKELSTVVVSGKAKRDEQGNLTVMANKVFVRPGK